MLIAGGGPAALEAVIVGTLVMEYHLLASLRRACRHANERVKIIARIRPRNTARHASSPDGTA